MKDALLALPGKRWFMGKLIVFYVPAAFKPSPGKWTPQSERGKIIDFRERARKSA
jgi:hypothetical protein